MEQIKRERIKLLISGLITIIIAISLCLVLALNFENVNSLGTISFAMGLLYVWVLIFGNVFGFIIGIILFLFGIFQLIMLSNKTLIYASTGVTVAVIIFEVLAIFSASATFIIKTTTYSPYQALGIYLAIFILIVIIMQSIMFFGRKKTKATQIGEYVDVEAVKNREMAMLRLDPEKEYAERKRKLDNYLRQGTYDQQKYDEELKILNDNYKTIIDEKNKKEN